MNSQQDALPTPQEVRNTKPNFYFYLICAIVIIYGSVLRFWNIRYLGLDLAGDGHGYIWVAKLWQEGKYVGQFPFRPSIIQLHAMMFNLLGVNDWSIKALHCFLDTINMVLILVLSLKIIKNRYVALCPLVLFAFFKNVIFNVKNEMLTAPSTTCALLIVLFMIFFSEAYNRSLNRRYVYLFVAGLLLAYGTFVHQVIGFMGLGCVIYISIVIFNGQWPLRKNLGRLFLHNLTFVLPFVVLGAAIFLPYKKVALRELKFAYTEYSDYTDERPDHWASYGVAQFPLTKVETMTHIITRSILDMTTSESLIWVFVISLIVMFSLRKHERLEGYLPIITILNFIFLYAIFFKQFRPRDSRYFIPFLPFFFIHIFYRIDELGNFFNRRVGAIACFACLTMFLVMNPMVFSMTDPIHYEKGKGSGSIYREVYDAIGSKVNNKNRLLLTPLLVYKRYMGCLQSPVYFGQNSQYLGFEKYDKSQTLESYIKAKNIAYIFVFKQINGNQGKAFFANNIDFYGMCLNGGQYTYNGEIARIEAAVKSLGGGRLLDEPLYMIYKTKKG